MQKVVRCSEDGTLHHCVQAEQVWSLALVGEALSRLCRPSSVSREKSPVSDTGQLLLSLRVQRLSSRVFAAAAELVREGPAVVALPPCDHKAELEWRSSLGEARGELRVRC